MGAGCSTLVQPRGFVSLPVSSGTSVLVLPGPCANRCRPVLSFLGYGLPGVARNPGNGSLVSWCRPGKFPLTPPSLPLDEGKKPARIRGRGRHFPAPTGLLYVRYPHQRSVAFCRFLPGRSMFLDFGSLHQQPRVGGTHGRVRRDGSDGWRSPVPRGDNTGSVCVLRQPSLSSPGDNRDGSFFLCIVTGAFGFWDFGSLYLMASLRPTGQLLRQRQTQRKTLRRP